MNAHDKGERPLTTITPEYRQTPKANARADSIHTHTHTHLATNHRLCLGLDPPTGKDRARERTVHRTESYDVSTEWAEHYRKFPEGPPRTITKCIPCDRRAPGPPTAIGSNSRSIEGLQAARHALLTTLIPVALHGVIG
ncbi:hypothetical protein N7510_004142 [Penicillium lagena]|uniref:uncharacterized protein n=1 Tax=Penicillium lagena TaxID=94218 RepID=UPI002542107C|nr:uncharacterized protein N7510_004142 [Penicillium lagena]KAJ5620158.1 hypothetical protein N7510_004142 [Penicillium lagena]